MIAPRLTRRSFSWEEKSHPKKTNQKNITSKNALFYCILFLGIFFFGYLCKKHVVKIRFSSNQLCDHTELEMAAPLTESNEDGPIHIYALMLLKNTWLTYILHILKAICSNVALYTYLHLLQNCKGRIRIVYFCLKWLLVRAALLESGS